MMSETAPAPVPAPTPGLIAQLCLLGALCCVSFPLRWEGVCLLSGVATSPWRGNAENAQ